MPTSRFVFLTFIFVLLLAFCTANATIINIPDDYYWIQVGIDSAASGDTILVQPGTYRETLVFHGTGITLASLYLLDPNSEYIESTIIDAARQQRAMDFRQSGDSASVVCGFTIRNGGTSYGGGVYCAFSSPTLRDLVIENCQTYRMGGGVYCTQESRPMFINVKLSGNVSPVGGGIGIAHSAHPTLINCEITGNTADSTGGGVFIGHEFAAITTDGVLIADNNARFGGGLYITDSPDIILKNVTICNNKSENGNGMYLTHDFQTCNVELINSIVYFNQFPAVVITGDTIDNGTILTISYSDIEDRLEGIIVEDNGHVIWSQGSIYRDPDFRNLEDEDYYLTAGSPCFDSGDPESREDPDGSRADMGAFFFDRRINDVRSENEFFTPNRFGLLAVYPNPFNSAATLRYELSVSCSISLYLVNPIGQNVLTLFDGFHQSGIHQMEINAENMASGSYVLRMTDKDQTSERKLILMD